MQRSSFFNAIYNDGTPDRAYMAEDIARYFSSFIGSGVYGDNVNNLKVTTNSYMTVSCLSGRAWINGYFYENLSNLDLTLDMADSLYARIDRIVCRLDLTARSISVEIKKGTPSSSPVAQTLTRNSNVYELGLADITVGKGATTITGSNIADLRTNNDMCGFVTGVVEQIETTGLFSQYDVEFNEWFDSVKGQLEGDIAGNLLNEIENIKSGDTVVGHASNSEKLGGKAPSSYSLAHEHPYLPTNHASASFGWNSSTGRVTHNGNDVKVKDSVNSDSSTNSDKVDGWHIWVGSQASYNAIGTKNGQTLYFIY